MPELVAFTLGFCFGAAFGWALGRRRLEAELRELQEMLTDLLELAVERAEESKVKNGEGIWPHVRASGERLEDMPEWKKRANRSLLGGGDDA